MNARIAGLCLAVTAVTAVTAVAATAASADDWPTVPTQFFGGGSLVTSDQMGWMKGGTLALDLGVSGPFAIAFEASVYGGGDTHMHESNFMLGPAFLFGGKRVQPFGQALVGLHGFRDSEHLGFLLGLGADVPIARRWSVRGEADWLFSNSSGPSVAGLCAIEHPNCFGAPSFTERSGRFSLGLVYASRHR